MQVIPESMAVQISSRSDYGTKNKQSVSSETPDNVDKSGIRMEDHCEIRNGKRSFVCVADGHGSVSHTPTVYLGGYESAMVATRTATDNMNMTPEKRFDRVQKALHDHSSSFRSDRSTTELAGDYFVVKKKSSPRMPPLYSMHGCTLSCLSVSGSRFQCSWVGDSSVLLYRGSRASWVTRNHDVTDSEEVKRVTSSGGSRYGKSYVTFKLPNKEEYMVQMTRSIGHFGNDAISHTPSVVDGAVEAGDVFVVATDGLWKYVSLSEVEAILADSESVDDICATLVNRAIKKRPINRDNACVVVVRVPNRRGSSWLLNFKNALAKHFI